MGRNIKPIKPGPKTPAELAQGRRDVMEDPDLGKHADHYVARRHNVRFEVVVEIRKEMGLAEPPRRPAKIDWSQYKTRST